MPGVHARLLLTLFTVSFWFSIPVVWAQETGTRNLLNQIKELKSIVTIEADELEPRERDKLTIARGELGTISGSRGATSVSRWRTVSSTLTRLSAIRFRRSFGPGAGSNSSRGQSVWMVTGSSITTARI